MSCYPVNCVSVYPTSCYLTYRYLHSCPSSYLTSYSSICPRSNSQSHYLSSYPNSSYPMRYYVISSYPSSCYPIRCPSSCPSKSYTSSC